MNKSELMHRIQKLSFAKVEAELFLDTHPDCPTALEYYHGIVDELDMAMEEYQVKYGPIRADASSREKWNWVDMPWPWQEMGMDENKAIGGGKR